MRLGSATLLPAWVGHCRLQRPFASCSTPYEQRHDSAQSHKLSLKL